MGKVENNNRVVRQNLDMTRGMTAPCHQQWAIQIRLILRLCLLKLNLVANMINKTKDTIKNPKIKKTATFVSQVVQKTKKEFRK